MRKLFWEMSTKETWSENDTKFEATTIFVDSTAAVALASNQQVSAKNKHIYFFITSSNLLWTKNTCNWNMCDRWIIQPKY